MLSTRQPQSLILLSIHITNQTAMKEPNNNSIIQTHYPIRRYRSKKRWVLAQGRPDKLQVMQNDSTEAAYHRLIALAKAQMKPGEVYYERNHKTDSTDGLFGMHSFVTPNFSISLFCELDYKYHVDYIFNACPYKAEVERALRAYPLDRTATARVLSMDYTQYYQSVLQVQHPKFIHTL
jgi:hypothetical protein